MTSLSARPQSGITLIEVLITVLVLAIGLLGIAAVQTTAMTGNFTSYQYTQAAFLASSMMERIRANRAAYANGNSYYQLTAGTTPTVSTTCYNTTCTPQQQAQWDMGIWYAQVTGQSVSGATNLTAIDANSKNIGALPGGQASITCDSPFPINTPGKCVVTVYWDPGRLNPPTSTAYNCGGANSLSCFRLGTVLP